MKVIGSILGLVLFSFASFSATYAGNGTWKSINGTSGEYSVEASITLNDNNTVAVDQTLTFDNQALEISFIIQKKDDTFFDVLDSQNQDVGDGYCWPLESDEDFVCHSSSHHDGFVVESTIKRGPGYIYRIGSKTPIEGGDVIAWNDLLILQSND